MAIPSTFGGSAAFPTAETPAAYLTFIGAQLDVGTTSGGTQVLAYALGGSGVNVFVNNQPSNWAYQGPFTATPKLIGELQNSALKMSVGFVSTLLPQLATTISKQSLNASTPAQVQAAMQSVIAGFISSPLA